MIHPSRYVSTIVQSAIAAVIFFVAAYQLYHDRLHLKRGPRHYFKGLRTHRVSRVCGFFFGAFAFFSEMDPTGAFGITTLRDRIALAILVTELTFIPFVVASYHSIVSTFDFLSPTDKFRRRFRVFFVAMVSSILIGLLLSHSVSNEFVYAAVLTMQTSVCLTSIIIAHCVYFGLRRLRSVICPSNSNTDSTGGNSGMTQSEKSRQNEWARILRTWRNYTICCTIAFGGMFVFFLNTLMFQLQTFALKDANFFFWPVPGDIPIGPGNVIMPMLMRLMVSVLLWKAWRIRDKAPKSTGTGSTGSGTYASTRKTKNSTQSQGSVNESNTVKAVVPSTPTVNSEASASAMQV